MTKKLSDMSLEELWQLFPIRLTGHQIEWKKWYEEERSQLETALPRGQIFRISHIGSTAVEGIWAKPIVDILVEMKPGADRESLKQILLSQGYRCMSEDGARLSFNKGYTEAGFAKKVFHLHLRTPGDNAELYFRDYLIEHPDIAREYEKLKLGLWKKFEHDRDGYTERKTAFVEKCTLAAKEAYGQRY